DGYRGHFDVCTHFPSVAFDWCDALANASSLQSILDRGGSWWCSNEKASLIAKSGLKTIHVRFNQRMSNSWEERHKLESKMRLRALRSIIEKKLDGIIMFAGDSNMSSMELFDEIQNVKWFGAVSVGILTHSVNTDEMANQKKDEEENPRMCWNIGSMH
ncbi:hypothetical protein Godav_011048, partial [Gossypium davidsonii]|nr:hypothetical protein [Gossypium davidsonii]